MGSDVEDAVNRRRQKPRRRRTRESWELIDGGLVQLPHFPLNKHEVPESYLNHSQYRIDPLAAPSLAHPVRSYPTQGRKSCQS